MKAFFKISMISILQLVLLAGCAAGGFIIVGRRVSQPHIRARGQRQAERECKACDLAHMSRSSGLGTS